MKVFTIYFAAMLFNWVIILCGWATLPKNTFLAILLCSAIQVPCVIFGYWNFNERNIEHGGYPNRMQ